MEYRHFAYVDLGVDAGASIFSTPSGISECNLILNCTSHTATFDHQHSSLHQALSRALSDLPQGLHPVFARYFLSDATNQGPLLSPTPGCAVSVVGQPPLNGSKCALWVYLQQDMEVEPAGDGFYAARHGKYTHLWRGSASMPGDSSYIATINMLSDYSEFLYQRGCSIAGNCQRTWFFVRDVDVNYKGMVRGRNESFATLSLAPHTHFIASTGICGTSPDPTVTVQLDTYAVDGLSPAQVTYIKAPTHLNDTYEYGVAFERATAIDYGDRRHLLVSGTASIDNKGQVVAVGDITGQTRRMLENVGALLKAASCGWADVTHAIVYLRDMADYHTVKNIFDTMRPGLPKVIVLAPVCRPGWLVEMECMAIHPSVCPGFAPL